jgi:hypothetical protein
MAPVERRNLPPVKPGTAITDAYRSKVNDIIRSGDMGTVQRHFRKGNRESPATPQ